MIWLQGFNGAGVSIDERSVKPLYARTQATPQARLFAKGKNAGVVPGIAAAGGLDSAEASDGEKFESGAFGSYGDREFTDSREDATVWVLSAGAMLSVDRSVLDQEVAWDGVGKVLDAGGQVFVAGGDDGRLTVVEDNPLAQVVCVDADSIVITNVRRFATGGGTPVEAVDVQAATPDFTGQQFAGKDLGTLTSGMSVEKSDGRLTFSGTINHVDGWTEFSANEEDRTGYYVPMELSAPDGAVLRMQTLGSGQKDLVFGQTGDGAGKIAMVFATKKESPTKTVQVFPDESDASSGKNANELTLDFSGCTFGE